MEGSAWSISLLLLLLTITLAVNADRRSLLANGLAATPPMGYPLPLLIYFAPICDLFGQPYLILFGSLSLSITSNFYLINLFQVE